MNAPLLALALALNSVDDARSLTLARPSNGDAMFDAGGRLHAIAYDPHADWMEVQLPSGDRVKRRTIGIRDARLGAISPDGTRALVYSGVDWRDAADSEWHDVTAAEMTRIPLPEARIAAAASFGASGEPCLMVLSASETSPVTLHFLCAGALGWHEVASLQAPPCESDPEMSLVVEADGTLVGHCGMAILRVASGTSQVVAVQSTLELFESVGVRDAGGRAVLFAIDLGRLLRLRLQPDLSLTEEVVDASLLQEPMVVGSEDAIATGYARQLNVFTWSASGWQRSIFDMPYHSSRSVSPDGKRVAFAGSNLTLFEHEGNTWRSRDLGKVSETVRPPSSSHGCLGSTAGSAHGLLALLPLLLMPRLRVARPIAD